ncbi:MAG: histidine--tRNA ligase [Bacteroidales bacterium]
MSQKPTLPKGTRDFTPLQMRRRNYIFDTIRKIFQLHAYLPIETPAMENLSTLMGKYGDEGDKLLFKILNSGDFAEKIENLEKLEIENSKMGVGLSHRLLPQISEKGLRYDLTVPFARFVVQHQNEINFPFKRYQIQAVWRADRPQKGRYREFYQCDADVVGSNALLHEAELVQMMEEVFSSLKIGVSVKINNRKILYGIAESIGFVNQIVDITVAIDKLDKIGLDLVRSELIEKGLTEEAVNKLTPVLVLQGDFEEKMKILGTFLAYSEVGLKGLSELKELFSLLAQMKIKVPYALDLTLARGLNYYTGAIFEVKADGVEMGSIGGGGRYDDLTGIFGMKGISGVGISFGADRIYDVLDELHLFPESTDRGALVLFVNFGKEEQAYVWPILNRIRQKGMAAELYSDSVKMQKQFAYADSLHIPYVAMIGEKERAENKIMLKEMQSGIQTLVSEEDFFKKIEIN